MQILERGLVFMDLWVIMHVREQFPELTQYKGSVDILTAGSN